MSDLNSNDYIYTLTKKGIKIVLLGECHYKDRKTLAICDKIINKYQCIGYENCKYPSGIIALIIHKVMQYFYRGSSIISKKILLGIAREKIGCTNNDNKKYQIIYDNKIEMNILGKEINASNTQVIDLEKNDKLSLRQYISSYYYDFIIIIQMMIPYCMIRKVTILPSLLPIFCIIISYSVIERLTELIFSKKSYEIKSKINYIFPTWDVRYRRDKIMADNINDYVINDNKKNMLAIFGKNHLEGIKYYLINSHGFQIESQILLEEYNNENAC